MFDLKNVAVSRFAAPSFFFGAHLSKEEKQRDGIPRGATAWPKEETFQRAEGEKSYAQNLRLPKQQNSLALLFAKQVLRCSGGTLPPLYGRGWLQEL